MYFKQRLTENQNVVFQWPIFFSASFSVFEMLIFGKLMKRRFQWYVGLPTFLLLFLLCVQSSKSCREGSVLTEPPLVAASPRLISFYSKNLVFVSCNMENNITETISTNCFNLITFIAHVFRVPEKITTSLTDKGLMSLSKLTKLQCLHLRVGGSATVTVNCVLEFLTSLIAKLTELSWHLTNNFFNDRKTCAVLHFKITDTQFNIWWCRLQFRHCYIYLLPRLMFIREIL